MVIQRKIKILERGSSQGSMKLNHLKLKQGQNKGKIILPLTPGNYPARNPLCFWRVVAGATRLELATSGVTGRNSAPQIKALTGNPNDFSPYWHLSDPFKPCRTPKMLAGC